MDAYVAGTEEIDFDQHLEAVGLEVAEGEAKRSTDAPPIDAPGACERRLGVRVRDAAGQVRVAHVFEGTPAHAAGINAGDDLIAIDGARATVAGLDAMAGRAQAGAEVTMTLMRRDQLVTVAVRVGPSVARRARIAVRAGADDGQRRRLEGWLGLG
jgi:predicted metalloprotease with PDZ domain